VLREALDTRIRTGEALHEHTGAPLLGTIPFDSAAKKAPLILDWTGRSKRAEAFRQLRTNLQFVDVDRRGQVLVVTSPVPAEGKSATAVNLAISFAEAGRRVLLVDADMRRPRIAEYLGLEGAVGLSNVLAGQADIEDVLQRWGRQELSVLTTGAIPPNPSELLASQNLVDLLARMRERFDTILIDTPPLLPVTDAAVAAVRADGAVLVVRAGKTSRAQVKVGLRVLGAVDSRLLGCVINMVPRAQEGYYYYRAEQRKAAPRHAASQQQPQRQVEPAATAPVATAAAPAVAAPAAAAPAAPAATVAPVAATDEATLEVRSA
jgi:capsular exopolysaccharide synthesis family protein